MSSVENVTDQSFEQDILQSNIPVLVDFWAEWCGPCKMVAPILDELAPEYAGKVKICKVNVDNNTEMTAKYGVRGIPTLLMIEDGQVVNTKAGAMNKAQLKAFIDEAL